jgi:PAS domain S-box-containing protein
MASTYSVEFASDRFCEILGITRQQFEANPGIIPDIVHPEDQADFARLNTAAILSMSVFHWEGRVMVGGERIAWIRFSSVPRQIGGGEVVWSGVVADITERKLAEKQLAALNAELDQRVIERTAQLEEANKELDAFSFSVSHDLRAPLRAIDGFTRILIEEYATALDSEGKRLGSVIRENTGKMSRLIDELLALSRLGRAAVNLSRIDMHTMATSVFHELTSAEGRSRMNFHVDNLLPVDADPTLMRQVWANLLSNAIKFSSKRERAVIQVSAKQSEGDYVYVVADNGAGFDMKYRDKLFGVFQRLHSSREFDGTGVGLALVQRIIRRHGGRVWAEGEVDQGASFCFALPCQGKEI